VLALDPFIGCGETEYSEEGAGCFFVACGNGPPFFQSGPEVLDGRPIVVDPVRAGNRRFVAFVWDGWACAPIPDEGAERVRGITFITDDPAGDVWQAIDQAWSQRQFMCLPERLGESNGSSLAVTDYASLGAVTATRAAKRFTRIASLAVEPLFSAPAVLC